MNEFETRWAYASYLQPSRQYQWWSLYEKGKFSANIIGHYTNEIWSEMSPRLKHASSPTCMRAFPQSLDSGDLDMFIDHSVLRHNSDFVTTRLQHCALNISKIYLTCRFIHNADNLDCNLQKNWKLDHDNRTFQSRWESEYLFIEFKGKPFMIDIVSSLLRNYVNHERFQLESPLQLLQLHWK